MVSVYPAGMWVLMQQFCQHTRLIFDEFEYASKVPVDTRPTQCLP